MEYKEGCIYKIFYINNPKIFYIGSTTMPLGTRWSSHKSLYKRKKCNYSVFKLFDEYGIDNFKIELIKSYNVVLTHKYDTKHLLAYEQLWINKLKGCCNEIPAFQPLLRVQAKIYREKNKTKLAEINKIYRVKNRERLIAKDKLKYANNREQILAKQKIKMTCICGIVFIRNDKARHEKSQRHKNYIKNNY